MDRNKMPTDEYYIHQLHEHMWRIYKVNDLHYKEPSAIYEVKRLRGIYYCDCPAPGHCKHIVMVQPKPKDLF
jgi:hypothetical protein